MDRVLGTISPTNPLFYAGEAQPNSACLLFHLGPARQLLCSFMGGVPAQSNCIAALFRGRCVDHVLHLVLDPMRCLWADGVGLQWALG